MIEEESNVDVTTEDPAELMQPDPEPIVSDQTPVQVISVDELIERLTTTGEEDQQAEEQQQPEETVEEVPEETGPTLSDQFFTSALEDQSGAQTVQLLTEIRNTLQTERPFLTTDFEDYTVTEGLLLSLLLCVIVGKCLKMLKEGFSWLLW